MKIVPYVNRVVVGPGVVLVYAEKSGDGEAFEPGLFPRLPNDGCFRQFAGAHGAGWDLNAGLGPVRIVNVPKDHKPPIVDDVGDNLLDAAQPVDLEKICRS